MASGGYAQRTVQRPIEIIEILRPEVLPTKHRGKPWVLCLIGAIGVLAVLFLVVGQPVLLGYTIIGVLGVDDQNVTPKKLVTASQALIRLNQTDPAQYLTQSQYREWYASSCSAAAMTMIINAHGHSYRIGDVLSAEIDLNVISPSQGLLRPDGIDKTAERFGFTTQTLSQPTLQQVLDIANAVMPA
jgi:hypothetical protein